MKRRPFRGFRALRHRARSMVLRASSNNMECNVRGCAWVIPADKAIWWTVMASEAFGEHVCGPRQVIDFCGYVHAVKPGYGYRDFTDYMSHTKGIASAREWVFGSDP